MRSESEIYDILGWFIGVGTADSGILSSIPSEFYTGVIPLLEHPNTDIGNRIVEIIHEILHDEEGFDMEIISEIVQNCLKFDLINFLVSHAKALTNNNEEDSDDYQAIYKTFEIIEDILVTFHNDLEIIEIFYNQLESSEFISFLIEIFKQNPKSIKAQSSLNSGEYANCLYAAELCSTIFQLSSNYLKISESVKKLWKLDHLNIIETILISLSPYIKRDPIDSDELEYLLNLFDCIAVLLLNSSEAKKSFNDEKCEGFQLFLLFLKELNVSRIRSIQIIDYSLAEDSSELANNFIKLGGLKVISPILMGKGILKLLKKYPKILISIEQDEIHTCSIISSLFKNVQPNSSSYFRLIAKFLENSGEKFFKLIEFHEKYSKKLKQFDDEHKMDENKEELLLDRINSGLFVLQQIDICLIVLMNSLKVLKLIGNNIECQEEIEKELFDKVCEEGEFIFKIEDRSILKEIEENVKEFLNELDDDNIRIELFSLLRTFL